MIREMKKEDFPEMMRIYEQSLREGNVTFQTEAPTYEEWDSGHCQECRFVLEEQGKIIGYTMIAPTSKREAYKGVVELSIFIDEAYHNRGYGTMLLKRLIEETEKRGYWTLYSAIFSVNKASIALHKKCGFKVIGIREKIAKDRFGKWADTTIMERRSNKII